MILAYSVILSVPDKTLARDVAIAAISGEIQIAAIIAAMGPIFFVVATRLGPTHRRGMTFKVAGIATALAFFLSIFGAEGGIVSLMREEFNARIILYNMTHVVAAGLLLIVMALLISGFFDPLFVWMSKPPRSKHRKRSG